MYVLGCRLSLFRLCGNDFGITAVDGITNGITGVVFCFHIAHISFAISWYLFVFISYCFGEIVYFIIIIIIIYLFTEITIKVWVAQSYILVSGTKLAFYGSVLKITA
jgi:hypothetical protein